MGKKFSELRAGDSVWAWWYTELYEYGLHEIRSVKRFLITDEGKEELEPSGETLMSLKGDGEYAICNDESDHEAFVYGCDGHEYKIFGTSKEAVKNLLQEVLTKDIEEIKADKQKWLAEFDK